MQQEREPTKHMALCQANFMLQIILEYLRKPVVVSHHTPLYNYPKSPISFAQFEVRPPSFMHVSC